MNKNLKKAISAVAALAISASAVSALAVNFPDVAEDASYYQAVQELTAVGVINGFEDGTFRPDELVTRAQITKMIVDALAETEQAEASKANSQFNDVSADHWAKGYINQGVSDQFIAGYSSTEFGPDDNVTYVQAQKMLVSAIGYETYAQGSGGWPNGYKTWAASQGITKGISGLQDDTQLTRAQVAQLIDNAMDAPICVIKDYEVTYDGRRIPNLEIKDKTGKDYQTLFTKMHDAYKVYGRVTKTNKSDNSVAVDQVEFRVEKADNFNDEYIRAGKDEEQTEPMYYGDTNAVDLLETYAQALIQIDNDDEYHILSIVPAAASKSVSLSAEDFDDDKSANNRLYFFPAGTTKNSVRYNLADEFTVYLNGKLAEGIIDDYSDLVDYIKDHDTASVTLQKTTDSGKTSTSSDYNLVQISSYVTAIVTDVNVKNDSIVIDIDNTVNGGKLTVHLDDENYSYSFKLDGADIDPADLLEDDILSIAYDESGSFTSSMYYDVLVSRDTTEGKVSTISSSTGADREYTIDGTKYKAAAGLADEIYAAVEIGSEYTVYLDHFGRIAKVDENQNSKKYGILKNIYKKAGGDWYAQIIEADGGEQEYKVDDKNVVAYSAILGVEVDNDTVLSDIDTAGVTYTNDRVEKYVKQVVEYSVASSTNKLTIKKNETGKTADDKEYKLSSGTKIGSVNLGDSTVILDISGVDDDEDISVVSVDNLQDGSFYSAVGYNETSSGDRYYRFVLLTDGTTSFNSDTQLAIYNGSELVEVDEDDRTAYNLFIDGEEKQFVVKDDAVKDYLAEGDVIVFTTNGAGEISKIEVVADGIFDDNDYDTFADDAIAALLKDETVINTPSAESKKETWNDLLQGKSDDVDIVFGIVANKSGTSFKLIRHLEEGENDQILANYEYETEDGANDTLDLSASGAKIYTYNFGASSKNSRVFDDEGLVASPDKTSYKFRDANGAWNLVVNNPNVYSSAESDYNLGDDDTETTRDLVFAIARVDDDQVKEIYLITYNN